MRSRVTFSALTVGQPQVILIDEALAVGDRQFARKAMRKIRDLGRQSSTVLICDHNLRRLNWLCNRGIVIEDGSVLADASIADAISQYEASSRPLHTPPHPPVQQPQAAVCYTDEPTDRVYAKAKPN